MFRVSAAPSTFTNDYSAAENFMALMKQGRAFFDARAKNFINCAGYDSWTEYNTESNLTTGGFRLVVNAPDSRFSVIRFFAMVYENYFNSLLNLNGFTNRIEDGEDYIFHDFQDKYSESFLETLETGVHVSEDGYGGFIALVGFDAHHASLEIVMTLEPFESKPGYFEMTLRLCYDYSHCIV